MFPAASESSVGRDEAGCWGLKREDLVAIAVRPPRAQIPSGRTVNT